MLRMLIADDHEIVRRGLKQILAEGFAFAHIDEAGDCPTLVHKALGEEWDIIVSDLAMPGGGGLEALKTNKESFTRDANTDPKYLPRRSICITCFESRRFRLPQ